MPALGVKSIAQLKSMHTSAHSMGNKATNRRKPLAARKAVALTITKRQWDDSWLENCHNGYNGSPVGTAVEWLCTSGSVPLHRAQGERWHGWVAMGKIQGEGRGTGGSLLQTTQPEWRGRWSIPQKWLTEVTSVLALALMGEFTFMDVCWKFNTAERGQSRRFLSEWKISSWLHMWACWDSGLTDLLFANKEGLVGDVDCFNDHEIIRLK